MIQNVSGRPLVHRAGQLLGFAAGVESRLGLELEVQRVAGAAGLEPALSRVTAGCPSNWTTPQQSSLRAVLPPVAH